MYFKECKNANEAKALYRRLAMQYHPDRGGDLRTMQAINVEYHNRLKGFDGHSFTGFDGKDHTYRYNRQTEQEILDKITELFKINMINVSIELIGTWLWVHGETKPYRDNLKKLALKWHSKRLKWFFHTKTPFRRKYSGTDFDRMRLMYGSDTFEPGQEKQPDREHQAQLAI